MTALDSPQITLPAHSASGDDNDRQAAGTSGGGNS